MKIDIYTLHRDLAEYLRAAPESQMRIARETGVSQSTLSRIMLGQCRPRIDTVQTLVRWLAKRRRQRLAVRVPKGALQPGHVVGQADVAPGQQLDQAALPAAAVPAEWPLHDRVEFALRDAGFDYDEASRIAMLAAANKENNNG